MTTLSDRQAPPATATTSRLRVVLLLDVHDGQEQRFLAAYEQIRHQVAGVPGHISDQLCQSLGNASQWLITSEWEGAEPFLTWVDSAAHRKVVEPLHACVRDTRSLRFLIARETPEPAAAERRRAEVDAAPRQQPLTDPLPTPPLASGGVVRHALTFTVKPGSERTVAELLAGYRSPRAEVDATTRLCRTSLFMRGNRVVRAVEVRGDLGNALRHVAQQPEVRAVEEAINPHLEEARDLGDPASARAFFARAALPAVRHVGGGGAGAPRDLIRQAFLYPVRQGHGAEAARLLAEHDQAAAGQPGHPLAGSTMFLHDDLLVRLVDLRVPYRQAPAPAAGFAPGRALEALRHHLDLSQEQQAQLTTEPGIADFLAAHAMDLVTDRESPPADPGADRPAKRSAAQHADPHADPHTDPHAPGGAPSFAATGE
ncbi:antibiotic biosynthesis monooxygenase [Kitasatospora sp. NBC_01287]|uniref:SchA/CurD-like domain-containing protein n=1 Tax=Kitasatospora sp. NBC_01287 TaxID=2903573 RepID=UPI00224CB1CF|nr:SchA/CurD-like domain-containing protein [Kitasatospora sp. NBC_01287]MCX4744155.1 antibiotic biosynthesis monooxygenase [Kitasatospora sp. NBC_01287]